MSQIMSLLDHGIDAASQILRKPPHHIGDIAQVDKAFSFCPHR